MKRVLSPLLVLAVVASFVFPVSARAWLLRVDFSVLGAANDPVNAGRTADGYFSFDSSLIPNGGGAVWGPRTPGGGVGGLGATILSFTWDGHPWSTTNADAFVLRFDSRENLIDWGFGGVPREYNAIYSSTWPDILVGQGSNGFTYTTAYGRHFYTGAVTSWSVTKIPEPMALFLLIPGLLTLGVIRRRRVS